MSTWPSIAVENQRLKKAALDLRKRAERIGALASACDGERVMALEDVSPQATVPREWMEFTFAVRDDAHTEVVAALSETNDFWLRIGYRPALAIEGRLRDGSACEFARLLEETLRYVQRGDAPEATRNLWKKHCAT